MYKLREFFKDAGAHFNDNPTQIETVEHCRVCKKGFKTKWGRIYKCKEHELLEQVHAPKYT